MITISLLVPACGGSDAPAAMPVSKYDAAHLLSERRAKDEAFRMPGSPLPEDAPGRFPGLSYYPPNPHVAFSAVLRPFEKQETARVMATKGDVRVMTRVGVFTFPIGETICSLTAFRPESGDGRLFLPFKDETNRSETYEVGRYIDLEELPAGRPYILDFNRAYNPYCAYNPDYSCPIVPAENVLSIPVPAGEKRPSWPIHGS